MAVTSGWMSSESRIFALTETIAFAIVYFCAGKLGLSLAFVNASASAVWPPTGLALAFLLWRGWRHWPGIFLGAFLVNATTQGSIAVTLGIACGPRRRWLETAMSWTNSSSNERRS